MASFIICGDFAPTEANQELIANEDPEKIIGPELFALFQSQNFVVINLETSLTHIPTPKKKRGQINWTIPEIANFFPKSNIGLCCLANNHVIDNGNSGVISTMEALDKTHTKYIGAGKTTEDASSPFVYGEKDGKVRVINIANFEFNKPGNDEYGVNIYDPLDTYDYIRNNKREDEYLVVVYHGGIEYYQYPSPELRRICRKMVDAGADLVTCQHSHCIGTYENYNDSFIMYGQGNFLFDDSDNELEKSAVVLQVDSVTREVEIIPIKKDGSLVRLATTKERKTIIEDIQCRHNEIAEQGFIEKSFHDWATERTIEVYNTCAGYSRIYKLINKITKGHLQNKIYSDKSKMRLYNMLTSVALKEYMEEVLKNYEK